MAERELIDYIPHSPERISAESLSRVTGKTERENRRDISNERIKGMIIASDDNGYYIPTEVQEIASYYRRHRKRAMTTLKGLKAARKALQAAGVDIAKIEGRK